MMTEVPNYYAVVPANVRYDMRLKAAEKLLYAEVTALCNMNGECYASNAYFASLYGVDSRTVRRWISNLGKMGYFRLEMEYADGGKYVERRYISIVDGAVKNALGGGQKCPEGGGQFCPKREDRNVLENNTIYNNTPFNNILSGKPDDAKDDVAKVIDYLNEKTRKRFSPKSKGNTKYITARLKEGYTVDDMKRVIDNQSAKWLRDNKMRVYLRPATLFNSEKFESYLNDAGSRMPANPPAYKPSMSEGEAKALLEKGDITSWME